jgi:sugar lactone lactonase YvrE
MESGLFHLHLQPDGTTHATPLATAPHSAAGMRFNDGRCDRAGRFWASTMVRDMSLAAADGALFRVDGAGLSAPQVGGLLTGNGLAFSPDNRVMYLSDSHPKARRVWAFDLGADGTLANRREFVDMNQHPGRPDGAAMDAEGCYWVCGNDAGQVHRFTPDGRLDRSIHLPVSKPAMCSFGGPGMEWMFVTSIPPATPAAGFDASLDGAVLLLRPGVRGLADVPFAF